jgi:hypothetical protein
MDFTPKNADDLNCIVCDFTCCKKSDWDRHISTRKHKNRTNVNTIHAAPAEQLFVCECGKKYTARNSLWYHEKKCKGINLDSNEEINEDKCDSEVKLLTNMVLAVVKQNQEILKENTELKHIIMDTQTQMIKVLENGTTQNSNNTTNSHNKAFNLNFFLNETCKDAMNITDFVESIKLQLSDLEKVGELGYVEGISNIIVKNLKDLDVTQRPVHCTDKKRETMYIKDEDKWEKDEEQKKMHKLVRKVADKNARMVPKFKEAHPDCGKSASRYSDQYNKIIMEAMGGRGDNDFEKEEKIIKRVSKEVTVEKEPL